MTARTDTGTKLTAVEAAWHDEYVYRSLFPMSHEQYLAEPVEAVEWLSRIHGIYTRHGLARPGETSG